MTRFFTAFLGAALVVAIAAGCDSEDTKAYDVEITWTVGGGTECSWSVMGGTQVPLEDVTVTVYTAEGDAEPLNPAVTVACADLGYTIPRLKRGTYFVEVEAWGAYEGQDLPILLDAKTINAPYAEGDDNDFTLILAPGDIHVTWSFDNGLMCGPNDVVNIDLSLADEDVPCDDGEYTITGKPAFAEYSISAEALDVDDEMIFSGEFEDNPFVLLPGEVYEAHIVLE